jgi:hypothetical protein
MKQNIIILITLIFSILSCKINMHLNKFEGYKGEPKLVVTSDYSVLQKNDTLVEELNSTDSTFFDKQGRAIQHFITNKLGKKIYIELKYDRMGNKVQYKSYQNDGSLNVQNNYKFNDRGQEIEREYISGGLSSITYTTYNDKNRVATVKRVNKDGIIDDRSILIYNKKWQMTEVKSLDKDSVLKSRILIKYDSFGNKNLFYWYDAKGNLNSISKNYYNISNDRVKLENFIIKNADTTLRDESYFDYEYDDKGNKMYESFSNSKRKVYVTRYSYSY